MVDTHGRTPAGARVRDDAAPTWVATAAELGTDADGQVDLAALLAALHAEGRGSVLLEGGPTLAGAFLRAGLVDRVVAYLAPTLLGAGVAVARPAPASARSPTACRSRSSTSRRVGPDVRVAARPRPARQRRR